MSANSETDKGGPEGHATDQGELRPITPEETAGLETAAPPTDNTGRLIESFISPRTFATQPWCLQNVASQPAGYQVSLGQVAGVATGWERKPGKGEYPAYIQLAGQFEAVSYASGEVNTAPVLILPKSAGELIAGAFQAGAERVLLDLEVGVRATGKSIPYAWTVRTFGTERNAMRRDVEAIRSRQAARLEGRSQKALAGPRDVTGEAKALLHGMPVKAA